MKALLANAILALSLVTYGVAFAQTPPNAGTLNRQIEREQTIPPSSKQLPEIRIQQDNAPAIPATNQMKIAVKRLQVTGMQVFSEVELIAATEFKPGSELTLSELRDMATKIAAHYHKQGYFLAQAYLPAQDIIDATVTLAVLEGQYGKVTLRNQTNLSDAVANDLLDGLTNREVVTIAPLESRLLLLSDLPGVNVKSTLVPGASVGTSDLIVDVTPGQRVTGNANLDNHGNRYTGTAQLGGTLNINNPFGRGDIFTLQALTSNTDFHYGRASYQAQVGRAQAGVALSRMEYQLGQDFASLQANGTAQTASIYGSYPLLRSRTSNLHLVLDFDSKRFRDNVDVTSTVVDKKAQLGAIGLSGDHRDGMGGGGFNRYSLTWTSGRLNIPDAAERAADTATVNSNGHYDKLGFNASRSQRITDTTSLYAAINGQVAGKNLDTSEKMVLGGAYGVRAYPSGEGTGDQGYVLNLEARKLLPHLWTSLPGQLQLIGFVDTGTVTLNKNAWSAEQNRRTLSGTGIGLNWSDNKSFTVNMYYAHKLGNAKATSAPDAQSRVWLQAVAYF